MVKREYKILFSKRKRQSPFIFTSIVENCPNYFLPLNNMFNGRFSLSGKEKLFQILCEVLESGLDWTSN
jgi:hypothetical protein